MKRRTFFNKIVYLTALLGSSNIFGKLKEEVELKESYMGPDSDVVKEELRIAVVQQNGNPGRVEENRSKAVKRIRESIANGADVILFHEEMLAGYVDNLKELAEPSDGDSSKLFQEALKGSTAVVIYGYSELEGDDLYISAAVVSAKGLVANYRKTHLWWLAEGLRHEPSYYKPGDELVTFDLMGHKCGIMICYDGDFPEVARAYAKKGCSVLFWMNNRKSRGNDEVKYLAQRNSLIIPTSCCTGFNELGDWCNGGSNITGFMGENIADIWDKEGVIIDNVKPAEAIKARQGNPFFMGMRPNLY